MQRYGNGSTRLYWAAGAVLLATLLGLIFWPRQYLMKIETVGWSRGYNIEALRTVHKTRRSSVPSSGRQTSTYTVYECSGAGNSRHCWFERRYDYDIEEFIQSRVIAVTGAHKGEPHWPAYTLSPSNGPYGTGIERLGAPFQDYVLGMRTDKGVFYEVSLPQNEWAQFEPQQTVFCTTVVGYVTKVRSMEER